jgi:glycosyltransferase involved in cell wall biosynthesis
MTKIAFLVPDNRQEFEQWDLPAPYFGPAPQALLDGFAQLTDCQVHIIYCLKRPLPAPAQLAANIFPHGLVVPPSGFLKTLYQGCVRAIRREIHTLGIDIVHGQGTERFPAYCAARSGLPNVITIHGNMRRLAKFNRARPFSFGWLAAKLEGYAVRQTDGVVCISSYTRRLVSDSASRNWIVPNAVDQSFFSVQRNPAAPAEILCVGHILPHKNQIALVHALEPLTREFKFTLKFLGQIGEDAYGREFLDLVHSKSWCQAPGAVDQSGLREALRRAAFLVLPSLEDNCPMVILEAMAAGVPVAASKIGGIPDLVEESRTGWLFDPNNPQSIQDQVRQLLADPFKATAMGQAARGVAEHRFRSQNVAARHLEIYREVIAARRKK